MSLTQVIVHPFRRLLRAAAIRVPAIRRLYDSSILLTARCETLESECQNTKSENENVKTKYKCLTAENVRLMDECQRLNAERDRLITKLKSCLDREQKAGIELAGTDSVELFRSLPRDSVEQYAELERRILTILGSKAFSQLVVDREAEWIFQIFKECVTRAHPNSHVFAQLIGERLVDLYDSSVLSLRNACRLYEAAYGLYWCGAKTLMDMRGFDEHAVAPFSAYLLARGLHRETCSHTTSSTHERLRIGYLCHYAHNTFGNGLAPLISAVVKSHALRDGRDIYLYCVQWSTQEFIDGFKNTDIVVRNFPNKDEYNLLENLLESLLADNLDVVITEIGSSIATYLFARRVAPVQMWLECGYPFWSALNIDWVLLHSSPWQNWYGISRNRCSDIRHRVAPAERSVEPTAEELGAAKAVLPQGAKVLAVFARLIKISSEYLALVKNILLAAPNAHFLIVGAGDPRRISRFVDDIQLAGRVTFIHKNVDLNVYGRVIDVFLDSFPVGGGIACSDVGRLGKPVVSMDADPISNHFYRDQRVSTLLASNEEEYFHLALSLITDVDFYEKSSQATRQLFEAKFDPADMISDIEGGIHKAIAYV